MGRRASKDTRFVGDRSRSGRVLDRRHVRAFWGKQQDRQRRRGGQGCGCERKHLTVRYRGLDLRANLRRRGSGGRRSYGA